jgi:hypothetical protein
MFLSSAKLTRETPLWIAGWGVPLVLVEDRREVNRSELLRQFRMGSRVAVWRQS